MPRLTIPTTVPLCLPLCFALLLVVVAGCAPPTETDPGPRAVQDSTDVLFSIEGLLGPEAVRFDADQDVYFISNFNNSAAARDSNGFVTRASFDGTIRELRFAEGTEAHPLHQPRGMALTADTLWVADMDGIHGFDRHSGDHVQFVDMTDLEPGFLNDIAVGPDGSLFVTDTGKSMIYRVAGDVMEIASSDSLLGPPNGITAAAEPRTFLLAPWNNAGALWSWNASSGELLRIAETEGGRFDGIELFDGQIYAASQSDSTLYTVLDGRTVPVIRTPGRGADIGVDVLRGRVAIPYIAKNRVDVWRLVVPE